MNTKRVYSVELLRFIFSFIIIIFHMQQRYSIGGFFAHGDIGVSFFFIISGWYMAKHVEEMESIKNIGKETILYTIHKISVFYIPFVICWFASYLYYNIVSCNSYKSWIINFVNSLPELLMIRMSGIGTLSYVGQAWYLSAMVLVTIIIFPIMVKFKELYVYSIAPVICIFLFGFISYQMGCLGGGARQFYIFQKGVLWAMSAMNLGIFMYGISRLLIENEHRNYVTILKLFEAILFAVILLYAITPYGASNWDFIISIVLGVFVMIEISFPTNMGDERFRIFLIWLGKYSLYIYLAHMTLIDFWDRCLVRHNAASIKNIYVGFVILTFIIAWVVMVLTKYITKICLRISNWCMKK